MKIAVTGSTGLVGADLVPFLTTGGHFVSRVVERLAQRCFVTSDLDSIFDYRDREVAVLLGFELTHA